MKNIYLRFALLATSSFAFATPAFAQNAPKVQDAPAATILDDIIVTARRVEERLQDVPISITVFNQTQLSRQNVVNAEDLAKFTPSLSSNASFGSENSSFAIRGFVQDIGTSPSVGVYFADVVAPRGGSASFPTGDGAGPGSYFDLQNVQVLKGPQGTLFGRNTTGGAVLLVPQRPTYKQEGYIEGSVGNHNARRLQAVFNTPLGEKARLRLGVDQMRREGWLTNTSSIGPHRLNDVDYVALRGSLVVDILPDVENYTVASYNKSNTNGPLQKLIACDPTSSLGGFACAQLADSAAKGEGFFTARSDTTNPRSDLKTWQFVNTTNWMATETLTVKNIVSYAHLKQTLRSSLFGTQFSTPAIPGFIGSYPFNFASILPAPNGKGTADQATFTEEFRLQGRSDDNKLTWQSGFYYEKSSPKGLVGNQSPAAISCTSPETFQCTDILGFLANYSPALFPLVSTGVIPPIQAGSVNYTVSRQSSQSVGAYAQAGYKLNEQVNLTGGIRYTWDEQKSETEQLSYRFPTFPYPVGAPTAYCTRPGTTLPTCSLAQRQKSSAPTWLLGIDYTPVQDVLLYAKYTRGYRTGGIKSDAPVKYAIFDPEKVDSYEAGLKSSFGGSLHGVFNATVFYNDFSNQQLQAGYGDNPFVPGAVSATAGPVNAGQSRIYGLEAEAGLRPFEGFSIDAAYAYLNTKIKAVAPVTLPATDPYVVAAQVSAGDELALSPKHKLAVTAGYTLPLDPSVGQITLGASYSYTSKQRSSYADRAPATLALTGGVDIGVLEPIRLLNLNVDWKSLMGSPVDLSFFATNVTKERYYSYVPGLLTAAGFEVASLGEPRMYGARLKYSF